MPASLSSAGRQRNRWLLAAALPFLALSPALGQSAAPATHTYYGNLHAHTAYSDGSQDSLQSGVNTPREAYAFARASQHFDFLGISEHNHPSAGMRKYRWPLLKQQADSATVDGQFVALYGMEWGTISSGGHVIVYGYDQLIGWDTGSFDEFVYKGDYVSLFRKIARRPGALGTLAHPNQSDFNNLLLNPFNTTSDSAIVGSVFRSGPAYSRNLSYSNQSTGSYEVYWQQLLAKGYHAAPSYDHDNHYTTFGRTTEGRLAVQADTLTRAGILAGLRARRFFATDDWNVTVDFTLNQQWPMGTIRVDSLAPTLQAVVADADGESFTQLQLWRGVPGSGVVAQVVATAPAGATALTWTDTTMTQPGQRAYYYLAISQQDGDRILSAPIWVTRPGTAVTGVAAAHPAAPVLIWPNPADRAATDVVTITGPWADLSLVQVALRDAVGRTVLLTEAPAQGGAVVLPIGAVPPGLYVAQLRTAGGVARTARLVIR